MKTQLYFCIAFAIGILSAEMAFKATDARCLKTQVKEGGGFAVVELFTSEGCSSCPPADVQIAKLQREHVNQPVYVLAYHVDYWNRLGWRDVFSSPAYSERQRQYSKWLRSEVYTPQAVVNGRKEFVGSEAGTLADAVKAGLSVTTNAQLSLGQVSLKGSALQFNYKAAAVPGPSDLVVVLVQPAASSQIKGGENAGRTLNHVQIVRYLQSTNLNGKTSGTARINVPAGLAARGLELIAFVQDRQSGGISCAASSTLN